MEDYIIITEEDEMFLTGFGYNHSMNIEPNFNFYND